MADAWVSLLQMLDASVRLATPLILCAMAGLFSERAGVVDIGLEGKMLIGAFAAAAGALVTGSPWAGLALAILAATALSLVHAFACVTHRGDQIVSGVAINILASGLTVVLGMAIFAQGGQTPPLSQAQRFLPIHWPGLATIGGVPVLGPVYTDLVSGHDLLVYLALMAVPLTGFVVFRTAFGLRLRAVGEAPAAVDSAGFSVAALRYRAVLIDGILCGIAGAYLSTAHGAGFVRDMSAGKGFIALAALIAGRWRPWPALIACLGFGFLESAAARLEGVVIPGIGPVPTELILVAPYIVTVVALGGFFGRSIPPRAVGIPYVKEH